MSNVTAIWQLLGLLGGGGGGGGAERVGWMVWMMSGGEEIGFSVVGVVGANVTT